MSKGHHLKKVTEQAGYIDKTPPRNPFVCVFFGFLFGPADTGIDFKSFMDFLQRLLITTQGLTPGWLFSAAHGLCWAYSSNLK